MQLLISGRVQGVGFRPFVFRLAHEHNLAGWVRNGAGIVEICIYGPVTALNDFADAVIAQAPPIAHPHVLECAFLAAETIEVKNFHILPSRGGKTQHNHVSPDYAICPDCLNDLNNPGDRRYRYPFINCTQCGPRYTLITAQPYDRPNTTLADFPMCPDCRREYENPLDRRFHAEPIACSVCGPRLSFVSAEERINDNKSALAAAVSALHRGAIVAVKGIGGYHLLCDARNEAAVSYLRMRKPRPHKPLAVLFAEDLHDLHTAAQLAPEHILQLLSPERPIVLVPLHTGHNLAPSVTPNLNEIGAMLPYSPLHHLLITDFGGPLVATSANPSGDPVLTENDEAEQHLAQVADAWLHHNRPIVRPADDSVLRVIAGKARPIRLGRGFTPLELVLPWRTKRPLLAVGGHLKSTIALAWEQRIIVSPHLGELGSPRSLDLFARTIDDLQRLYGVQAEAIICDAHPNYASTRWATAQDLPVYRVWHHHAHASAVAGEHPETAHWLAFAWDSVGLGPDGTLWGGETLYGFPGSWERVGHLRPFKLPGGNRASFELWRSAAALCWEVGLPWPGHNEDDMSNNAALLTRKAWEIDLNCHKTTAAGRIFDAAAALLGLVKRTSFEGQGPMYLETVAEGEVEGVLLPLATDRNGLWNIDWAPLVPVLCDTQHYSIAERAAILHESLAQAILAQVRVMQGHAFDAIALTGGVFQNRRLTERVLQLLKTEGFAVFLGENIPCNDAGLSFGQVIEYTANPAAADLIKRIL